LRSYEEYRRTLELIAAGLDDGSIARTLGIPRRTAGGGCVEVCMRSRHWPCLFPQHGPGRKHEREIRLADWQRGAVDAWPEPFLRGLVQTDGCRFVARDRSGGKVRAYTRYSFSNRSEDIKALFVETCRRIGVHCTRAGTREIAIARRADVRRLDEFIGPKR
jgi:hypothetical protein